MGKISCYFQQVRISVLSVSMYLHKLEVKFLKHETEDEMVLYGCMLKQYRLHCSWALHISCEHLYKSMYKLAPISLEICRSEVYFKCKFCFAWIQWSCSVNAFCFEVLSSSSNSNRIRFKYLVDGTGFKFLFVFKACWAYFFYCFLRLEMTTKDSTHA